MPQRFYPAVLYDEDATLLFGVVVPGINVNVSGSDAATALEMAAAVLQDVIDDLAVAGIEIPPPLPLDQVDAEGGRIVLLPATLPGKSTRINVTMDEDLVRRIDAVSSNRSSFLASAARAQLASAFNR